MHPPVVASVEQTDVLDAAVRQDQRSTRGGDLTRATSGPLLVRVSLGVPAVEDDGRVEGDAELADRRLELGGRPTVPVGRVLEPVGVEVEGARNVTVLVLLRNAEVHVEEQMASCRRSFRPAAIEKVSQPVGVNEALVVGKAIDRQALVCSPRGPLVVRSDIVEADLGEPRSQPVDLAGAGPVEDERGVGSHALHGQKVTEVVVREDAQPRARQRHRARHVTPARLPGRAPAVERMERPRVDDRQARVLETELELRRRQGRVSDER